MIYPFGNWRSFCVSDPSLVEDAHYKPTEIIKLCYCRTKTYVVVLSRTCIYLWKSIPQVQLLSVPRDKNFIETFGYNKDVVWRADTSMISIVTDKGWLLVYRLMNRTKDLLFNYETENDSEKGYIALFLQLITMFRLPDVCIQILARRDIFMVSTKMGSLEIMTWPQSDGMIHHNTFSVRSIVGFKPDAESYITAMDTTPWSRYVSFVMNNGIAGLFHIYNDISDNIFNDHFKSFVVNDYRDITAVASNSRFQFVVFGHKSGLLTAYKFDDKSDSLEYSHSYTSPSNKFMGVVTKICWNHDFTVLACTWDIGNIGIWSTYGFLISQLFPDADQEFSSKIVTSMDWGPDSYYLSVKFATNGESIKDQHVFNEVAFVKSAQAKDNLCLFYNSHYFAVTCARFSKDISMCDFKKYRWILVNLPLYFQSKNFLIKNCVADKDNEMVAVSCQSGYLLYSWKQQRWLKTSQDDESLACNIPNSCMCWWNNVFFFIDLKLGSSPVSHIFCRIFSNHKNDKTINLHSLYTTCVMMRSAKNILSVFTLDSKCHIFWLDNSESSKFFDKERMIIVNLSDVIPHPLTLIDYTIFDEVSTNESLSEIVDSVENNAKHTILLNVSGTLVRIIFDEKLDDCNYVLIENCTESFYISNNFIWIFSGSFGLKCLLSPKNSNVNQQSGDFFSHCKALNPRLGGHYPIGFDLKNLKVVSCESEADFIQRNSKLQYHFSLEISTLLPNILLEMLRLNLSDTGHELINEFTELPEHRSYFLEIMMHRALELRYLEPHRITDLYMLEVVKFIKCYDEHLDVFCYCARKTEIKLWNFLFYLIGRPRDLFMQSLERSNFDTASSYLIILFNLESFSVISNLCDSFIEKLIKHEKWKILKQVCLYLKNVKTEFESQHKDSSIKVVKQQSDDQEYCYDIEVEPSNISKIKARRSSSFKLKDENNIKRASHDEFLVESIRKSVINLFKQSKLRAAFYAMDAFELEPTKFFYENLNHLIMQVELSELLRSIMQEFPYTSSFNNNAGFAYQEGEDGYLLSKIEEDQIRHLIKFLLSFHYFVLALILSYINNDLTDLLNYVNQSVTMCKQRNIIINEIIAASDKLLDSKLINVSSNIWNLLIKLKSNSFNEFSDIQFQDDVNTNQGVESLSQVDELTPIIEINATTILEDKNDSQYSTGCSIM